MAVAAIVATALIIAFLLMLTSDWLRGNPPAQWLLGLGLCGLAAVVSRRGHDDAPTALQVLRGDLMLAVGLCGFALVAVAIGESSDGEGFGMAAAIAAAALVAVIVNAERVHRFLLAITATVAGGFALTATGLPLALMDLLPVAVTALWLTQSRWAAKRWGAALEVVAAAMTVTLLALLTLPWFGTEGLGSPAFAVRAMEGEPEGLGFAWLRWGLRLNVALCVVVTLLVLARHERRLKRDIEQVPRILSARAIAAPELPAFVLILLGLTATWCLVRQPFIALFLLIWTLTRASGHPRLAALTLVAMVASVGIDYWNLAIPLATKGWLLLELAALATLVATALVAGQHQGGRQTNADANADAGVSAGRARQVSTPTAERRRARWPAALAALGIVLFSVGYGRAIHQSEQALQDGLPLILELAPRDPRAFLTGDYMVIDLAIASALAQAVGHDSEPGSDAWAVLRTDPEGVSRFVRVIAPDAALGPDEQRVRGRYRDHRWRVGTDAFYFPEGQAKLFESARYGLYRLTPSGDVLLTGLLDEQRRPLAATR